MKKKTVNKLNGGIAIYFGISTILGALAFVIGIGILLFKVFTGQAVFSFGLFIGLAIAAAILGFIGYSVLKVGYEELEK